MSALISYGIGYTPNSAVATTLVIQPPPVYAAENMLIMGVIAGGPSGGVAAELPSGWTQVSASGATLALFVKAAAATESAYTVTLASACCAAGFVAAYPGATIVPSFGNSGGDIASWTATFPSDVTSGETVLMLTGSVANAYDVTDSDAVYLNNTQNVNLPSGWTADVPVFGPVLASEPSDDARSCCIGLAEITGSSGNPVLTNTDGGVIYAGFLVTNFIGTAPSPYQVTATSGGTTAAVGMALTVKALTGAATVAEIVSGGATASFYANGTSQAPQASITPNASGSVVYGALTENYGVTSGNTFTADSSTTFSQNVADTVSSAIYGTLKSGVTTASTGLTLGGTAPDNAYTVAALAEILAASGSAITEAATATVNATYPGQYYTTAAAQTAVFASTPAAGDLLVAMVSANSDWTNGDASVTVTDSSGLTWTELVSTTSPGYAGVFIAQAAAPPPAPPAESSYTLSVASAGTTTGHWGDIALVFTGSAGTGASAADTGTGTPSLTLTTTGNNSAIAVIILDANAVSGSSRTWLTLNGYTPSAANGLELDYTLDSGNYGVYVAYYPNAGPAGIANTVGLAAPSGMKYTAVALEVLGAPGGSGTDTGTGDDEATVTATITAADTWSGTDTATGGLLVAAADSGTGTESATAANRNRDQRDRHRHRHGIRIRNPRCRCFRHWYRYGHRAGHCGARRHRDSHRG